MKNLLIFLLILSIVAVGCSQGTNYNNQPAQPNQQSVGGGCGVAPSETSADSATLINAEIKSNA